MTNSFVTYIIPSFASSFSPTKEASLFTWKPHIKVQSCIYILGWLYLVLLLFDLDLAFKDSGR